MGSGDQSADNSTVCGICLCDYEPDDTMAMELMAEFGDGMSEELDFEHFAAMLRALDKARA